MTDLEALSRRDAVRIEIAMRAVADTGPVSYHVFVEVLTFVRKGVKAGDPYRIALRDRFELITGHAWPDGGRPPPLH